MAFMLPRGAIKRRLRGLTFELRGHPGGGDPRSSEGLGRSCPLPEAPPAWLETRRQALPHDPAPPDAPGPEG